MKKYLPYNLIEDKGSKLIISIFFVVSNLCIPKVGFTPLGTEDFCITNNLLFPLCHANIFHLLCNLWCLWLMREPYYIYSGIIISFLCSLLPEYGDTHIMGMSGILFATIGAKFGRVNKASELFRKTWFFFVITVFLPNVACLFHLYCVTAGYMWGYIKETIRLCSTMKTR